MRYTSANAVTWVCQTRTTMSGTAAAVPCTPTRPTWTDRTPANAQTRRPALRIVG
ncbi:hypothetical protein ACIBL8_48385 [Streptomyces sp. NPDC050523]|uniref:hypothetical protein n=1 Tax=Streptomyces sp. NPDC050523 TaxID=3365622 RepID=UPI0037B34198